MDDIELIKYKIYDIRGQKVMLDRDIAILYGVETKRLNEQVKRNIERFPEDFMFQLSQEEFENWKSQIATSNSIKMGLRRPPYAFTEHGVAMLASVLTSKIAVQVNISIVRAFVAVRQMMALPQRDRFDELKADIQRLKDDMEDILRDQNDTNEDTRLRLECIEQSLAELQADPKRKNQRPRIGFVHDDD